MPTTKQWVLGLLFTPDFREMVFTEKTHGPGQMAGKLNGIGGHQEPSDGGRYDVTMSRECAEETGLPNIEWQRFGVMSCEGEWDCVCFVGVSEHARELDGKKTDVEELLRVHPVAYALKYRSVMANLHWLIPLAVECARTKSEFEVMYPSGKRGDT